MQNNRLLCYKALQNNTNSNMYTSLSRNSIIPETIQFEWNQMFICWLQIVDFFFNRNLLYEQHVHMNNTYNCDITKMGLGPPVAMWIYI